MTKSEIFAKGLGTIVGVSEPVLASTTLVVDEYRWNGHCYVPEGS